MTPRGLWTRFKRRKEVRCPNGRYLTDVLAEIDSDDWVSGMMLTYAYWSLPEDERAACKERFRLRARAAIMSELALTADEVERLDAYMERPR